MIDTFNQLASVSASICKCLQLAHGTEISGTQSLHKGPNYNGSPAANLPVSCSHLGGEQHKLCLYEWCSIQTHLSRQNRQDLTQPLPSPQDLS
jgi:hypothetical protein